MTISDVKSLLEKVSGVPLDEIRLFNEEYSQNQLEGPMECSACGLIAEDGAYLDTVCMERYTNVTFVLYGVGAPAKTLTMMVTWTLYVREDSVSATVAAKMQELGMDVAVKIHVVEGVEKHWKVESVKRESRYSEQCAQRGRGKSLTPVYEPLLHLSVVRLEKMTGVPAQDQRLHVVTQVGW